MVHSEANMSVSPMETNSRFRYKVSVLIIKRLAFIFLLVSAVTPDCATAVPPRKLEYPVEQPSWIVRSGDRVEQFVEDLSEGLDVILAGRKYKDAKKNESQIKIRSSLIYREGGKLDKRTRFSANLRLPNLERRWQLRFTSYDEEEESRR